MLTVVGRTAAERAKAITIVILVGLLTISLRQVSSGRAEAMYTDQARQDATAAAWRFVEALTTYDYGHIDLYMSKVGAVCSPAVRERVGVSSIDIASSRASSIGDVLDTYVGSVTSHAADVLVRTSQVVSGTYLDGVKSVEGLIDVSLTQEAQRWVVTDFRWVIAPFGA